MTLKASIIATANETLDRANVAQGHAAMLAGVFGSMDPMTVDAQAFADRLYAESANWTRIANLHPKTRAVELKKMAA